MTSVHLLLAGGWAECPDEISCALLFHVPGMSVAEAASLPESVLYPLFEVVQPPSAVSRSSDGRSWMDDEQKLHRDYDLPAKFDRKGRAWYQHGLLHRVNGPAVITLDGSMRWYQNNEFHRDGDLPAYVTAEGTQYWYSRGLLHRDNAKPAIIHDDGREEFYVNGNLVGRSSGSAVPGRFL